MKTTISIFAIFLLTFSSVKTLQAQTCEETISWLREKLEENIRLEEGWNLKNLKVSPYEISWEEESDEEFTHGHSIFSCSFNPVLGGNWSADGGPMIVAEASIVMSRNYSGISGLYEDHGQTVFIIEEGEDNLAENIAKALNHLAAFCGNSK